jgi:hypothetical protein
MELTEGVVIGVENLGIFVWAHFFPPRDTALALATWH